MNEQNDQLPPSKRTTAPNTVATSSSTSITSVKATLQSDVLPNDLSALVESVFVNHCKSKESRITSDGSIKSTTTATTIPDWESWWNDINKDVEVSHIFSSCVTSILNGAYQIASQRIYETAVNKKNTKTTVTTTTTPTPTVSNQKRNRSHVETMDHNPERRRTNVQDGRDMRSQQLECHSKQHHDDYYRNNINNNINNNKRTQYNIEKPFIRNTNGERRMNDSVAYYPPRDDDHHYRSSHSNSRESQNYHTINRRPHPDEYRYPDDENYSYNSRGHRHYHHHNHHHSQYNNPYDRPPQRHDRPYPKEEYMSTHENDHRSLASSISTKPQNGLPKIQYHHDSAKRHLRSPTVDHNDEYRRQQPSRRRSESSSSSSCSSSSSSSSSSRSGRNSSKSRNSGTRGRTRRRADDGHHSQSDNNVRQNRKNRHNDKHSDDDDDDDKYHRARDANSRPDSNQRIQDDSRGRDDNKNVYGLRKERHRDEASDRHSNHKKERKHNDGKDKEHMPQLQLRQNDGMYTGTDGTLPIVEVTTNGEIDKDAKKHSPRKSSKSKHRKSSSHHKRERCVDSESSRNRRHGSNSRRKRHRRGSDGTDNDNHGASSASPRKRSGKKRRKKRERHRHKKESEIEGEGVAANGNSRNSRSDETYAVDDKVQVLGKESTKT